MNKVYILALTIVFAVFSPVIFNQTPLLELAHSNAILLALIPGMATVVYGILESRMKLSEKQAFLFVLLLYLVAFGVALSIGVTPLKNFILIAVYVVIYAAYIIIDAKYSSTP